MKKSAAIRSSVFTPALTKALKSHCCAIHCQTVGDQIYIANGFYLVKLTPAEYDEFVRPATQRDPGSWALDENGQLMEREPMDAARTLADYAAQELLPMYPAPFIFQLDDKKNPALSAFHTPTGNFVAFFDARYSSIVSKDKITSFRGRSTTSAMLAYAEEEPVAMLLPFRVQDNRIISAALAYFGDDKPDEQPSVNTPAPKLTAALEEIARLREELAQAQKQAPAALEEIARLREELAQAQKQAPAAPNQPANKTAAVLASLESLDGIKATVKGAQTSSPVVWIDGNTKTHEAALEKLGAKWSRKRAAYYIQAA